MDKNILPYSVLIWVFIIGGFINFLCSMSDISDSFKEMSESLHTIASMK